MAWVSCTLLLYNLEKKRDEKCKESFMAPREKEEKGRKNRRRRNSFENNGMALQGRMKINWKICEWVSKATVENMRGATSTREWNGEKKITSRKSLKAFLLLLWHAIVSDHFSSFTCQAEPPAKKNPKHYEGMSSVVNEDAICSHNLVALSIGLSAIKMACLNT